MDIEQIRTDCLSNKRTSEDFPFDKGIFVFEVVKRG